MPKPKNPLSPKPVKKVAAKKTAVKTVAKKPAAKKIAVKATAVKTAAKKVAPKTTASKVKKAVAATPADKIEKYVTEQRYLILKSLDDGKAEDILDFDLRGVSSLADYTIIASGRSTRQVSSLAENISKALKAAGHKILGREGQGTNDWVIVDTGDIIVHILRPEVRSYYRLEEIWGKLK